MVKFNADSDTAHVENKQYIVFSYISPESILNCNSRLIKFRGAFPTYEKALEQTKLFNKQCDIFDIYIAETSAWFDISGSNKHSDHFMSKNSKIQSIYDVNKPSDNDIIDEYIANQNRDNESVTYRSKDNNIVNALNNKLEHLQLQKNMQQ